MIFHCIFRYVIFSNNTRYKYRCPSIVRWFYLVCKVRYPFWIIFTAINCFQCLFLLPSFFCLCFLDSLSLAVLSVLFYILFKSPFSRLGISFFSPFLFSFRSFLHLLPIFLFSSIPFAFHFRVPSTHSLLWPPHWPITPHPVSQSPISEVNNPTFISSSLLHYKSPFYIPPP